MILERTIIQLDTGPMLPEIANQMGKLGYMQWIASLRGGANYCAEARHALDKAEPFSDRSPAVAVFCRLLQASIEAPLTPLPLEMPPKQRRGGAHARRASRMPNRGRGTFWPCG